MATRKKTTQPKVVPTSTARRSIRIKDFFNSSVKSFSIADCIRSIPGVDGLKPSQRKALYGTVLRGESAGEIQIERLSAAVAASTDYHHGTVSLGGTIINMAATLLPGANNMNLFVPEGQFGSRLTKEAGQPRYVNTYLSPYFRMLFPKADDCILEHNYVDGQKIEPMLYLPIMPLVLINGATGTGTGHSCEIKSYHPMELREACIKVLDGKKLKDNVLVPWFRGFNGTVERNDETGQVITKGTLEVVNTTTIKITELPVGKVLDDYKDVLNKLEDDGFIKDYDDASSEKSFNFLITCPRTTTALSHDELMVKFKLIARDTENFTQWQPDGTLKRLNSAEEVVAQYVMWRTPFYEVRRQRQMDDVNEAIRFASEQVRFIKFFIANTKKFRDTKKADLIEMMLENNFVDYEKLLAMAIWSLTHDRIVDLNERLEKLCDELDALEADDAVSMYRRELMAFKYTKADEELFPS